MEWRFRPLANNEKKVDSINESFFSNTDVGGPAYALVRETIQNSLDAKFEDKNGDMEPVLIRFFFSGEIGSVPPEKNKKYFNGLMPHLFAEKNGLRKEDIPDFEDSMPFLVVEDFNTTGLRGDPRENKDPEDGDNKNHSFYWFWRNVGRSDKSEQERGRWGVGKTVFPASSRINTFFGLTKRQEDDEKLLMGQSVLTTHNTGDDTEFCPYGDFGKFEGKESDSLAVPLTEYEIPDDFEEIFSLTREDYMGLSIIIPFPEEDITPMKVIEAVASEYFYPIVSGDLLVMVEYGGGTEIKLTKKNIEAELKALPLLPGLENILKLIEFARWTFTVTDDEHIVLNAPDPYNGPSWSKELLLDKKLEKQHENKQDNFDEGEGIAFRVPVKVEDKGKKPLTAWFSVYIEKDEGLSKATGHFIREGITLTGVKPYIKKKDIRYIVNIDDPILTKMLGDAENPAHTQWQKDSINFRGKYEHGGMCLSFIENSVSRLVERLIRPPEGIDEDILSDIFSLDELGGEEERERESEESGVEKLEIPKPPVESRVSKFSVTKITGGVKIRQNPNAKKTPPDATVKLGYSVSRNSAIGKYSPADFNIAQAPIELKHDGIEIITCNNNELEFEIKDSGYWIELKGFDSERDLVVKAEEKDA